MWPCGCRFSLCADDFHFSREHEMSPTQRNNCRWIGRFHLSCKREMWPDTWVGAYINAAFISHARARCYLLYECQGQLLYAFISHGNARFYSLTPINEYQPHFYFSRTREMIPDYFRYLIRLFGFYFSRTREMIPQHWAALFHIGFFTRLRDW